MKTVGEKVYVQRIGSFSSTFSVGEVIKVTPTGKIDVDLGWGVLRFSGDHSCTDKFHKNLFLDTIPFGARKSEMDVENRAKDAAKKVNEVQAKTISLHFPTKEKLMEEIKELQRKLDEAKAAVEAI